MWQEVDSSPYGGQAFCEGPTTTAGHHLITGKQYSGERVDRRETLRSRHAFKCCLRRTLKDLGWRWGCFCGGYCDHGIAFNDKRPELCSVPPGDCRIRYKATFVLDSQADEFSVRCPA